VRKILLVEDENALREAYTLILTSQPYELHVVTNGQEALEKCLRYTYDLILLDLMMPVLNGVGFLEEFSRAKNFQSTKIIVLSNLSSGKDLTKALSFGVRKAILKAEISPSQLLSAVRYELDV
jgi:DNA-binding response OmpR family regulator